MKHLVIDIFVIAAAMLQLCGCSRYYEPEYDVMRHYVLTVENNSNESITWIVPDYNPADPGVLSPDVKSMENVIAPGRSQDVILDYYKERSPLETYGPEEAVTFYFFLTSTLRENTWEDAVNNKMWLESRSLTPSDVINAGKVISYPEYKHR